MDPLGNAYITGATLGSLGGTNQGGFEAFLVKYDWAGNLAWTAQIGASSSTTLGLGVAADTAGNAYITGVTDGSLGGANSGGSDAFLAQYTSTGSLAWATQLGTSSGDGANGLALDGAGNVYIAGNTFGDLGGPNQGDDDTFLAKYAVPEPATLSMLALGGLALIRRRS